MNLKLNAKQKIEIEQRLKKATYLLSDFTFITCESECVYVFVQHAYRALDGNEPTTAEAISYRANPEYFFTFERNDKGIFFSTAFPELEVGRSIQVRTWEGLLDSFAEWLTIVSLQIKTDGTRPVNNPTFSNMVHERNYLQVRNEFVRAEQNCTSDPAAAIAAASSMVESACKLFICDHDDLDLPTKQTIKHLWSTVAKFLLPRSSSKADDDTKRLVSGLASVVDGLGSLRTHASSAHGRGRSDPQVGHAEALLAINASQTLVLYMMQKWDK
jgi:abortive infection Abi-like protein